MPGAWIWPIGLAFPLVVVKQRLASPAVTPGMSLRWLPVLSTGRLSALVRQSAQTWPQLVGRVHNRPVGLAGALFQVGSTGRFRQG